MKDDTRVTSRYYALIFFIFTKLGNINTNVSADYSTILTY